MTPKKKKSCRDPILMICQKIVETHEARKESIKLMKEECEALFGKLAEAKFTDMPVSHGNEVSDPVQQTYYLIEQLKVQIEEEQKRVEVVEAAIKNIGYYESDPETRKQIRDGILNNIQYGGFYMPYQYIEYPEEYNRYDFYRQRKHFLLEIAKNLQLVLKS